MRGIILAAGKGVRLDGISGEDPKCLLEVGGLTLIERQIRALKATGIDDITAVVGFGADRVRDRCGPQIRYIANTIYDKTNSLYSLWLARHLLPAGFVVLNADVLFHPQILEDLLTSPHEDALLIARCEEAADALGDEEMKVKVRGERVVDISKEIAASHADGENVGVVKFGPSGARLLVGIMESLIAKGNLRAWAPRAFCDFATRRPLHAISTRGYPWIEIDFPEDYIRAVNEVLPEINANGERFNNFPSLAAAMPAQ